MDNELLTIEELCKRLKVTRQTIYNYLREGMPRETNNPPRYVWEDVLEWIKKRGE